MDGMPFRQAGDPESRKIICVADHASNFVPDGIELGI